MKLVIHRRTWQRRQRTLVDEICIEDIRFVCKSTLWRKTSRPIYSAVNCSSPSLDYIREKPGVVSCDRGCQSSKIFNVMHEERIYMFGTDNNIEFPTKPNGPFEFADNKDRKTSYWVKIIRREERFLNGTNCSKNKYKKGVRLSYLPWQSLRVSMHWKEPTKIRQ